MHKFLLATTALVALTGSAFAADLPSRKGPPVYVPPVPVFTWTGVYIGGQIGYAWDRDYTIPYVAGVATPALGYGWSPSGVVGGAHIGYNYQVAQFVFGLEGDVEGSSLNSSVAPTLIPGYTNGVNVPIQGSVRGRAGFAVDRALFFATGGAAFASIREQYFFVTPLTLSSARVGWTVGGGIEYAVTNNWTIRGEYLYTDYGRWTDFPTITPGTGWRQHLRENAVKFGFSYKFDMFAPPAPVVAKY